MNNHNTELERWLAGSDIFEEQYPGAENWSAAFDADRQAVVIKLGPYKRLYLRPQRFTKRFYHQLYPLKIEAWSVRKQIKLFEEFCTVDMTLDLRFQATLAYIQKNCELLSTINQHIKQTYSGLIEDIIHRALQTLEDGEWVHSGLSSVEQSIANSSCELLAIHQVQAQATCNIKVSFQEFSSVQPGRDTVYLHVLQRTFEANEQKNREVSRQQRLLERQELEEKRLRLQHLKDITELELRAQALEAEKVRRLLEEKEDQLAEQLAIEKRIYAEQIRHEAQLKEIALDSELRMQEQHQAKQRFAEIQRLTDELEHLAAIRDKKLLVEKAGDRNQGRDTEIMQGNSDAND